MEDLGDLRGHIASLLPAKGALRARSISRAFLDQVDQQGWRKEQALNHKKHNGLFIQPLNEQPGLVSPEPDSCGVPDSSLSYLGCTPLLQSGCSGLTCVRRQLEIDSYCVTNPVTQQRQLLPPVDLNEHISAILAVDRHFPAHYTVVCPFRTEVNYHLHVYSSEREAWVELDSKIDASIDIEWASGVVCNNMIFWRSENELFSYSVSNQVVHEWPVFNFKRGAILGTVDGVLVSAVVEMDWFDKSLIVHRLVDEGDGSWCSLLWYRKKLTKCRMKLLEHARVLSICDEFSTIDTPHKIIILNLETGDTQQVLKVRSQQGLSHKAIPYVNSFMDFVH